MTETVHKAVKIFCSYSHRDEKHLNKLKTHLAGLRREGLIEDWHDRKILPGHEWNGVINNNLEDSEIILLLISPDFVDSDYCYETEVQRALDKHQQGEARVIPIIIRPTDWERVPFSKLQALPKDAKPIVEWRIRDNAWLDVTKGIRQAVEESINRNTLKAKPPEKTINEQASKEVAHIVQRGDTSSAFQTGFPMSAADIRTRYKKRILPSHAVRLVPQAVYHSAGRLVREEQKYVFVGDCAEQRNRTLRQILSNLWVGGRFESVNDSNVSWYALVFEIGEINEINFDLKPATYKAAFRILSDPKRAKCFCASEEEFTNLGDRPDRDYYSDDQNYWYGRLRSDAQRSAFLATVLGVNWFCFTGEGITHHKPGSSGIPSRVFFVKNVLLSDIENCKRIDLGVPNNGCILY